MPTYKNGNVFTQSQDTKFDAIHNVGATVPFSGIYRCAGCGKEIVSTQGNTLPTQNHHQHSTSQGSIRWQLVASHQ